jgi:hypothetical protein
MYWDISIRDNETLLLYNFGQVGSAYRVAALLVLLVLLVCKSCANSRICALLEVGAVVLSLHKYCT